MDSSKLCTCPPRLAMATVPNQEWCEPYNWAEALADLFEDLAAEQKARTVYENLLRVIDNPDVIAPLKFLRAREIVHFQRFGEALEMTKETLSSNNFYHFNPEFDKRKYNLP